jgi:hypothetical protein
VKDDGGVRLSSVERGSVFTYYGPRRGLLRRRGIAAGVVLAIDQAIGIVHVRTMRPVGEVSVTDVGHIPILWSAFGASVSSLGDKAPEIAQQAAGSVAAWRQRHARGEVGAFSCPLWEAERMAWEVVSDADKQHGRDRVYLAYAFPKKDAEGSFRTVEVGVHKHDDGGSH